MATGKPADKPEASADKQTKETPRQRFERVGGSRVANALAKIDLIGNVSDLNRYQYSQEDIDKAFAALQDRLNHAKNRMIDGLNKKRETKEKSSFGF